MKKFIRPTVLFLALILCFTLVTSALAGDGSAPVARNLELDTYRGVSVGGTLSAVDPDGDAVSFEITTQPVKGEIELEENGRFVYTPGEGKRGKDYFGYKAVDSQGNTSQEATVIINIQKQKTKVTYSDMSGDGSAYAAVALAESGIFVGECLAGEYVFSPETPVTREEFLAMCMKVSGAELLTGVSSTGFADDESISAWARPYVSTALYTGLISGYADSEAGAVFNPGQFITMTEAAVMLDRALDLTSAVSTWYAYDESVPAWAVQSAANLESCGLMSGGTALTGRALTRAQAAELLAGALELMAGRQQ